MKTIINKFKNLIFGEIVEQAKVEINAVKPTTIGAPITSSVSRIGPKISIINYSTVLTDAEVSAVIPALQIQLDRDFSPVWDIGATLVFQTKNEIIPDNNWVLGIYDSSDQSGALGYHELTNSGKPVGKVFAADDKKYNLSWTVTLSHELLEMVLDPYINYTVFAQESNTTGKLFALEVADAVEDDQFGYLINGVLVSDWVYPSWFESWRQPNSTKFDHLGKLNAPFELLPGGYIGYFDVTGGSGWQQAVHQDGPGKRLSRKGPESRSFKRPNK